MAENDPVTVSMSASLDALDKFDKTLGGVVRLFGQVEMTLHAMMRAYGNIAEPVADAIFSGVRIDQAIANIRAILQNTGASPEFQSDINAVMNHLAALNEARNRLAHYLSSGISPEGVWISNALRAKHKDRYYHEVFKLSDLENIKADLDQMIPVLINLLLRGTEIAGPKVPEWPRKPWLYKPPSQPISNRSKRQLSQGKPPKQPRQPPSSQK